MNEVTLIRSRRRTVALEIKQDCRIVVRAPLRMPQRDIDDFVARHTDWIRKHLAIQQARMEAAPPPPSAEDIAALKRRAREILPGKVADYSRLLGVTPTGITITSARTRYGSCSAANRLCFSCFLMNSPEEAIDLVVVHELCHIQNKNHGPGFYRQLASVFPDHQERKRKLAPLPAKPNA